MSHLPLISVVTVVKNQKEKLKKTLDSVKNQNYPNIEHIIVDGASADGTIDIVKDDPAYSGKWISEPDEGLYDAMNKGKALANGDFVYFLNSGDVFLNPNTIENMEKHIDDLDKIYYGNVIIFNGNISWTSKPIDSGYPNSTDRWLPHHQAILFPRSFYKREDYNLRYKVISDGEYILRACDQYDKRYCNIDIVRSELGGFGINHSATLKRSLFLYKEKMLFMDANPERYKIFHKCGVLISFIIKYALYKIGGVEMINYYFREKMKITLLFGRFFRVFHG